MTFPLRFSSTNLRAVDEVLKAVIRHLASLIFSVARTQVPLHRGNSFPLGLLVDTRPPLEGCQTMAEGGEDRFASKEKVQREESKKKFSQLSQVYDNNPMLHEASAVVSKALREEVLRPDMEAMDFGCGTGLLSFAIAGDVRSVLGVDSSEGMIRAFQSKIDAQPAGCNLRCTCIDLVDPAALGAANDSDNPYPEQFDLITSSLTFHHVEDIPAVLKLLISHLKPGGVLAVFDYQKSPISHRFHPPEMDSTVFHKAGFTQEELCQYFTEAGLESVSCREVLSTTKPFGDDPSQQMNFELLMVLGTRGR